MMTNVSATYENGVLKPTKPLALPEGTMVDFVVELPLRPPLSETPHEAAVRRIREAKNFDEWIAAAANAAQYEPNDGYDLLEALNENRRAVGARLLFDPERKGIDW